MEDRFIFNYRLELKDQKSHDHPKIFKYPVHVLKTERSVATKEYLESFSFAHVVKTDLSAGTGPRGGWA